MDTITHAFLGALTARACYPAAPIDNRPLFVTGAVAGAFPDIDYVLFWVNPLTFLADWHRSLTHSFVMLPVWALAIGFLLALAFRQRTQWYHFAVIAGIGVTSHILADILTVYGTQIFAPLSENQARIGTTFVIDGFFTAIVVLTLLACWKLRHRKFARWRPVLGLCILCGYIGLQALLKSQALRIVDEYAKQNLASESVTTALPQPFSPFHWKLIARDRKYYHVSYVDLANGNLFKTFTTLALGALSLNNVTLMQMNHSYRPISQLEWSQTPQIQAENNRVVAAWAQTSFARFREFAQLPAVYRTDEDGCVWFTDLRYVFPRLIPSFRYGWCHVAGHWSVHRLRRFTENERRPIN